MTKEDTTRVQRFLNRLQNHPVLAVFIILCIIIISLSTFTDSIDKLASFAKRYYPKKSPKQQKQHKITEIKLINGEQKESPVVINKSVETVARGLHSESEQGNTDLENLYKVAEKIYGVTPRNKQYLKIIDVALNKHDLEFAFTVAKNIYGTNPRNEAFKKIIIIALKMKKYNFATVVADEVYGANAKNEMYTLIITEKSKSTEIENSEFNKKSAF